MNHITWNHLEVAKGFTLPKSGLWLPIALLHFPRVSIVECGLLPLYSRPTLVVATFTPGSNSWRVKLLSASGGSMLCEKHRVERPLVHMSVINTGTLSPVWFNSSQARTWSGQCEQRFKTRPSILCVTHQMMSYKRYFMVLLDIRWYMVSKGLVCLYIL